MQIYSQLLPGQVLQHPVELIVYKPEIRILPGADSGTHHLQLSGTNSLLVDLIQDHFKQTNLNTSRNCTENKPRSCDENCNSYTKRQCEPGCAFDYDSLGECRDKSFGYDSTAQGDNLLNPCFFLYFQPVTFWNPKYMQPAMEIPNPFKEFERVTLDQVPDSKDDLQLTCYANIISQEIDLYPFLLEMVDEHHPMDIQKFIDDKELFEELVHLDVDIEKLIYAQEIFGYDKQMFEATKVWTLLDDTNKKKLKEVTGDLLDEQHTYYDTPEQTISSAINLKKVLQRMNEVDQKTIIKGLTNMAMNKDDDPRDVLEHNLQNVLNIDADFSDKLRIILMRWVSIWDNGNDEYFKVTEQRKNLKSLLGKSP